MAALAKMALDGRPNRLSAAISMANAKQADIAAATGFTQSYISAVSNGRYQTITVENAHKFAEFLGAPIEVLFPNRDEAAA